MTLRFKIFTGIALALLILLFVSLSNLLDPQTNQLKEQKPSMQSSTLNSETTSGTIKPKPEPVPATPVKDSPAAYAGAVTETTAPVQEPVEAGTAGEATEKKPSLAESQQTGTATVKTSEDSNHPVPAPAEQKESKVQAAAMEVPSDQSPIVSAFRSNFGGSPAQALVGRAIWYMEYGYMVYGHKKYPATGYIDCSIFVALVYHDFGYTITSAARKYGSVGQKVEGVYVKHQKGSTTKHVLMGTENLKPGDIFTFWKEDSDGNRYIGHVAIYMGKINGKPAIIQTCKGNPTAIGITTSFTYWYGSNFLEVRRVLPASAYQAGTAYTDSGPVIPAKYQMKPGPVVLPQNLPKGF